jgi:hypothetical protein
VHRLLMVACRDSEFAAALAARFAQIGFAVAAVCPSIHVLSYSSAIETCFRYSIGGLARPLRKALSSYQPILIIPCDDPARSALSSLHATSTKLRRSEDSYFKALIQRSLGSPEYFSIAEEKSRLMAALCSKQIRLPATTNIADLDALRMHCQSAEYPLLLKRDHTWGGKGVEICRSSDEAIKAYRRLTRRPAASEVIRDTFNWGVGPLLADFVKLPNDAITAQAFIKGRPANRAVACWEGKVLAGVTVEVIESILPTGPGSVVRIVDNLEIERMVGIIGQELSLSGLYGFDFILEHHTDLPYFLELNARATPTCHLGRTPATDICKAIYRSATCQGDDPARGEIDSKDIEGPIALFPTEWYRCPNSPELVTSHHLVPWDDPKVLAHFVISGAARTGRSRPLIQRLLQWLARRSALSRPYTGSVQFNVRQLRPPARAPLARSRRNLS